MADLMELYGGLGPGVGAMYQGQNQASKLMMDEMQRKQIGAGIENTMGRLQMDQQMHPLNMAYKQAETGQTREQTRGMKNTNDVNSELGIPLQVEGRASEIKSKVRKESSDQLNGFLEDLARGVQFDTAAQTHKVNTKSEQAQWLRGLSKQQLQQIADNTSANREKRAEEKARAARERERYQAEIASREKIAREQIAAGRFNRTNGIPQGFDQEMSKAKGAVDKLAVVKAYQAKAMADPTLQPDERLIAAKQFNVYIDMLKPLARAELEKFRNDGQITLEQFNLKVKQLEDIGGPRVEYNPPGQTPPEQPGQADLSKFNDQQKQWIERAVKANPNIPIEKIIEAGKQRGKL